MCPYQRTSTGLANLKPTGDESLENAGGIVLGRNLLQKFDILRPISTERLLRFGRKVVIQERICRSKRLCHLPRLIGPLRRRLEHDVVVSRVAPSRRDEGDFPAR